MGVFCGKELRLSRRAFWKAAFIEYLVWLPYPDKADMKLVMVAMNHLVSRLKQMGGDGDDLLQRFRSSPEFAWLPWRKLIS